MIVTLTGFRPPSIAYLRMKAVYDACCQAGVSVPAEVVEFFGTETPDDSGLPIALRYLKPSDRVSPADRPDRGICDYAKGKSIGIQVDLNNLDPTIRVLRFVVAID